MVVVLLMLSKIKLCLVVSIDLVGGRNIFFTTAWVSQIFIMTDSRIEVKLINDIFLCGYWTLISDILIEHDE